MRIAIFSYARTGSTTLYKYIKESLYLEGSVPPYTTQFFKDDYKTKIWEEDSIVVKFMFEFLPLIDKIQKSFDKIIFLSRESDIECAKSFAQAIKTGTWYYPYEYKDLPEELINQNVAVIKQQRRKIQSLGGFQITYEEVFYTVDGIKRLNNYLGIVTNEFNYLLHPKHRLRQNL